MNSEYTKIFDGITASEQAKTRVIAKLLEHINQSSPNSAAEMNKPNRKQERFSWNLRKTLIAASSVLVAIVMVLCAVLIPIILSGDGGFKDFTHEQKINEIKRVFNGAYDAYLSKISLIERSSAHPTSANLLNYFGNDKIKTPPAGSLEDYPKENAKIKTPTVASFENYLEGKSEIAMPLAVSLEDYVEEHGQINIPGETKKVYDRMFAWYTIILRTLAELKGTDVLFNKYIISEESDLVSKVSGKFADISSPDIDFDPIQYAALITSLEICGVMDNTVYSKVTINTISCNFTVYYNDSSDYGFIIQTNTQEFESFVMYDNNDGDSQYIGIEETGNGYCYYKSEEKEINFSDDNPDHVEWIAEIANRLQSQTDSFNNSIKAFSEKQETVLIFD